MELPYFDRTCTVIMAGLCLDCGIELWRPSHRILNVASFELHKISVLRTLKPRREPYWGPPLSRGWHVGFRKGEGDSGNWIARYRASGGKQLYKALAA